jgi:hypothetical protein
MITRATGWAGQQHARLSSHSGDDHWFGTGSSFTDSDVLPPSAPLRGKLGSMS